MAARPYRLTVLGTALAWLMVGLHLPALHPVLHHGAAARWDLVAVTLLLAVAAMVGTWALLRGPAPRAATPPA